MLGGGGICGIALVLYLSPKAVVPGGIADCQVQLSISEADAMNVVSPANRHGLTRDLVEENADNLLAKVMARARCSLAKTADNIP